jgi:hypothetical protein
MLEKLPHTGGDYSKIAGKLVQSLSNTVKQVEECVMNHVAIRRRINIFWKITIDRLKKGKIIYFTFSIPEIIIYAIRDFRMNISFGRRLLHRNY